MLQLLLRLLLAFLALRWVFRRLFRGPEPAQTRPFAPPGGRGREKPRASRTDLSPHPIEDADFEELPRG